MEKKLEGFKTYTIDELKLEDADLQMMMTMGVVVGGNYLDLLSLRNYLEKLPNFKLVYKIISTAHLRVVKVNEFEEFLEWKKNRRK